MNNRFPAICSRKKVSHPLKDPSATVIEHFIGQSLLQSSQQLIRTNFFFLFARNHLKISQQTAKGSFPI
jgi:hypothetical protein